LIADPPESLSITVLFGGGLVVIGASICYNPELKAAGRNPFILDSTSPDITFKEHAYNETRFSSIARTNPEEGECLLQIAQRKINQKWGVYGEMATRDSSDLDSN